MKIFKINPSIIKIFINSLLFLSIFLLSSCKENVYQQFRISETLLDFLQSTDPSSNFIAHAGGGINDHIYSNSEEAIELSISNNFKMIEVDLLITSDEYFVGGHSDWPSFKNKLSYKNNNQEPMSLKEVNNHLVFNKYKPITINKINEIFSSNKYLFLVTDKNNNFEKINSDFKFDKDRIIVEIFGRDNYFLAIDKGVRNPLFNSTIRDYDFILDNNIKLISVHHNELLKNKIKFNKLRDQGVLIFTYSSNEKNFIKDNLGKFFDVLYTDFWNINAETCNSTKCITY